MANTAMEEWKKKWSNYTQNSGAQSAPAAADPSQKNSAMDEWKRQQEERMKDAQRRRDAMTSKESLEDLNTQRNAAIDVENTASRALSAAATDYRKTKDAAALRQLAQETIAARDERAAIDRKIDKIEYVDKYKDKVYDDTFAGQFGANKALGRIGQDTAAAYNEYIMDPTEENKAYADALAALQQHFQLQNEAALDDENAKATWITKSAAQYLPQLWDQTKAGIAGGAAGAAAGAGIGFVAGGGVGAIPGAIKGAKVGATAASGIYNYGQMRGAAYSELLAAGVDEETARAAANDEGVISGLLEMGDTALTIFSLGTGKLVTALGKGGVKAVAGEAADNGAKRLLKALGKYGVLNIGQEMLEEGSQQAVSIANRERATASTTPYYGRGNIDLNNRPVFNNADGTISTVDSTSFNIDGKEVLLPTVWMVNGRPYHSYDDEEILQHYFETGEFLGIFDTPEEANEYAEQLHLDQADFYGDATKRTGIWNLVKGSASTAWDAITGENTEARDEILEASKEGGKIATMFGGVQRVSDFAAETAVLSMIGKKYAGMGDNAVPALIETGLESEPGTDSRKIAEKLQEKQKAGKEISSRELGSLVQAIESETDVQADAAVTATDTPQKTLEGLARETVAQRENIQQAKRMAVETMNGQQEQPVQQESAPAPVPINVMSDNTPIRQQRIAEAKAFERSLGYGEKGMEAFNQIVEESGETPQQVRRFFQTAYETGMTGLPVEKAHIATDVQRKAYYAGLADANIQAKAAQESAKLARTHQNAGFNLDDTGTDNLPQGMKLAAKPADVTDSQVQIVDNLAKKLGVRVRMVSGDSIKGNAEIHGNEVYISETFNRVQGGQNRSIVFYAAHEIGMHRLMKLAPDEGRAFINAIIQDKNSSRPSTAATVAQRRQESYAQQGVALSTDAAMEEIAADSIMGLYESDDAFAEAIERVFRGNDEQAKEGARQYKNALDFVIQKLKEFIGRLTGKSRTEAKQALSELEHQRDLYERALKAAMNKTNSAVATKNATQEGDVSVQHSISKESQEKTPMQLAYEDAMRKQQEDGQHSLKSGDEGAQYSLKDANAPVEQAITSAKTSIMQIPALFKHKAVVFGKTNVDIGGGRFDLAKNYLAERGTKSMIFDPYNRGAQENSETLAFLQSGKRADTATCANVLNVIAEPAARSNVILEAAKAIKPDGTAYFMVYEGNGTGIGKQTSSGWQNNRMTADYVDEMRRWFRNVETVSATGKPTEKGKLIVAKNPVADLPKAAWEIQPGEAVMYSLKDDPIKMEQDLDALRQQRDELQDEIDVAYLDDLPQSDINKLENRMVKLNAEIDKLVAQERKAAVKTSMNDILSNLGAYRRSDLESLAEQISDGNWDGYEDLSRAELEDALREEIEAMELSPLEMQSKKKGLYVRPVGQPQFSLKAGDETATYEESGVKYSIKSLRHDITEGRMFDDLVTAKVFNQKEADLLKQNLDKLVSYMLPNANILDMNEEYGKGNRPYSAYKPNSDPLYVISLDFSTLCRKRLMTQYVIEQLQLRENRPMTAEEQIAVRSMLLDYRQQEQALQVACAMCYVEAARLKAPKQMERFFNDTEAIMRKYFAKKDKAFNDKVKEAQAKFKRDHGYDENATKKDMSGKDTKALNEMSARMRKEYTPDAKQQAIIDKAKSLPRSTFLTAGNLTALAIDQPDIYAAYTDHIRASTRSKSLESDIPYYYGDSQGQVSDTFIDSVNAENGMRFDSWSDFQMKHMLDMITAVIDLSVRGSKMHGYTKFPEMVRIFGKTGMMFNLSGVTEGNGFDANGDLLFSSTEGIDIVEARKLLRDFPETAGLQCIGVSDDHVRALLRADYVDYVIPYHTSGMNATLRKMAGINAWKDYTSTQHARKDPKAKKPANADKWQVEPVWSEFYVPKGKNGLDIMRKTAQRYIDMCHERGLIPKFDQFMDEPGYWKLLVDRKMVNQVTGEIVEQKPVKPIFDFDLIKQEIDREVSQYDPQLEKRALKYVVDNFDAVHQRIRDLKKGHPKKPMLKMANEILQAYAEGSNVQHSLKEQSNLERENAKLKEVNRELRAQFKTTKFAKVDRKALNSFTKQLLKDYSSDVELEDARAALDGLYTYLANGENGESAMWQEAYDRAFEVSKSILESSRTMDDEMYRTYKALRDDLRKNGIALGAMGDGDLMGYESIAEFKRANRGRIKISESGTPIDIYYQALALDYPEFFDADEVVTPADQLLHIEEVLNKLQPMEVNPFSHNMEEAATWLANDILERFFELPQAKPTFADKAERKLTRQMIKDQEKLDRLRDEKNAKIAELIAENRDKLKDAVTAERMAAGREMGKLKQKYAERAEKAGERKKASILRARIIRHARDMSQKLLRPSDKQHIPENLRGPVASLLDAINMESQYTIDPITGKRQKNVDGDPTKRTAAFDELRKAYKAIIDGDGEDIVVDPAIELMLDDVLAMRDVRLADMTSHQLKQVWDVLRVMEHTVSNAGKLLSQAKYARTVEWADAFVSDTKTRRGKKGTRMEGFRLDLENPYTFFSHYGDAGKEVFRMLRDAQDEQQVMVENVRKQVQEIVDAKTVKKLEKEVHTFTTERGDKLTLTTAQVMEVYLLMKREQAQAHLMQGGIVQPEIESKKIKRGTDAILLTANDLSAITGKLDAKQKEIANKLQALTSTTLADYGNKASMKAYGYKKFTGTDYWPIKSAREGIHANVEKGGNNTRSIKNIGLAKTVMPGANNPLDIGGAFKTFASHAADMTDYAAWLCPMEDANRLFNFQFRDGEGKRTGRTIKGLLDRVGGKGAQDYWHRLMEDIQNGIKTQSDSDLIKPINKIIGNTRGASVGANIRVIIQQPTAIFRAGAVLSPEAMFRGMFIGGGWKTALKHSPIAMRKDMGGFDISSPMQMNEILFDSKTKLQRFNEAMMWGAGKADAITWGRIWNACESEVLWNRKDLAPRSDAFYEAVNELFTEVVDQSQVVDGVLQRSQVMRSGNALLNQATAFMGEPTMAMNMMLRAYDGLINEQDAKKRGKALKTFGRTAAVLLITNVVNALAQSLVDAVRDDEDDEYWKKFWNAFFGVTGEEESAWDKATGAVLSGNLGSGMNPVGYVPFAKDILSILQGYNVTRADADVMGDIIDAMQGFWDSVAGDGKKTIAKATFDLLKQGGKVWGVSAFNLERDIMGIVRTIAQETGNLQLQYKLEKAIYKIGNEKNTSHFVDILYKAYTEDKAAYDRIYSDLIAAGIDADKIHDRMEKLMKVEQGVTKVDDLEQRYLNPKFQSEYDSKLGTIKKNKLWSKASDAQRDKLEDNLYELIIGSKDGEKLQEKIDGGKSVGLDDTEYLLYKLALDMYDQPTENGKYGSYTQDEAEAAIAAIAGLTDKERAYLWQSTNKGWKEDKNPWR